MLAIPGEESLVSEQADTIPQMRIEVADQVFRVANVNTVRAPCAGQCRGEYTFSSTLEASDDKHDLARFGGFLKHACGPLKDILEMTLVASTDHIVNMIL